MAVETLSLEEETGLLCDGFDSLADPKTVYRSDNNALYLALKSMGEGMVKVREIAKATQYRFDPRYCAEDDLESLMKITGVTRKAAKSSLLKVTAFNTSDEDSVTLKAGTYVYYDGSGNEFDCTVSSDVTIASLSFEMMVFSSVDTGSFPVSAQSSISVSEKNGIEIDENLQFVCTANTGTLGRAQETLEECRTRILSSTSRHDVFEEMKEEILAIPTIYACEYVFNDSADNKQLDNNVILAPFELLLLLSGSVTSEVADIVCSKTWVKTHQTSSANVVYHDDEHFVDGHYAVYYSDFSTLEYQLTIYYSLDGDYATEAEAKTFLTALFAARMSNSEHVDTLTENDFYEDGNASSLDGVKIIKIYMQIAVDNVLTSVPKIDSEWYQIPVLTQINFIKEDV